MRAKGVRSTFGGLGSTKVETCVGRIERKEFQVHTAVVVQPGLEIHQWSHPQNCTS